MIQLKDLVDDAKGIVSDVAFWIVDVILWLWDTGILLWILMIVLAGFAVWGMRHEQIVCERQHGGQWITRLVVAPAIVLDGSSSVTPAVTSVSFCQLPTSTRP